MRWMSDRRSAEDGEISVLAIIETVVAGALAYLFYRWTNELWHIGVAACLAPLLLLRTSRITRVSLRIADTVYRFSSENEGEGAIPSWGRGVLNWLLTVSIPLVIVLIKFASTLFCFIAHPLESVREIPRNWQRVVLCTDLGAIPELIPTIEEVSKNSALTDLKTSQIILSVKVIITDALFSASKVHSLLLAYLALPLLIMLLSIPMFFAALLIVLPGLAYRYAVKSTALIWSSDPLGSEASIEPRRY